MNNKVTIKYHGKDVEIELTENQIMEIEKQVKVEKFFPQNCEIYWFVYKNYHNEYAINKQHVVNYSIMDLIAIQNIYVFRTEAEAEIYKHYLETLETHAFKPNWKDINEKKYFVTYNFKHDVLDIDYITSELSNSKTHYFESIEKVTQFIAVVGKENVKKFMFDVWGN